MADKRAYFKLDVGYLTNPKVALLSIERPSAVLLHIASIAYSAQHLTDGIVPVALLLRLNGAATEDADALTDAGLWHDLSNGKAEIHDYLEHQRSSVEAKGAADKARKAAETRWNPDARSMPASMPTSMPEASETAMPREKERKREVKTSPADAEGHFDSFWRTYPRKEGKGNALKAWRAAAKKEDADQIIHKLATRAAFWTAKNTEREFIPMPATWLNQERWNDEFDIQSARPKRNPNIPEGW